MFKETKVNIDELVLALGESYMTPDTPMVREVLMRRHDFPMCMADVQKWYGMEISSQLINIETMGTMEK